RCAAGQGRGDGKAGHQCPPATSRSIPSFPVSSVETALNFSWLSARAVISDSRSTVLVSLRSDSTKDPAVAPSPDAAGAEPARCGASVRVSPTAADIPRVGAFIAPAIGPPAPRPFEI